MLFSKYLLTDYNSIYFVIYLMLLHYSYSKALQHLPDKQHQLLERTLQKTLGIPKNRVPGGRQSSYDGAEAVKPSYFPLHCSPSGLDKHKRDWK